MGAGWPPRSNDESQTVQQLDDVQAAHADKLDTKHVENEDLGFCNVWVGTIQERQEYMDEPPSRRVKSEEDEWHLMGEDAGITLVYLPFIANDKVEGVDPMKSDFMSTWNFVYTPEEIEQVVALARANFDEGEQQIRRTIRAVYQRKKAQRLQREEQDRELRRRYRLRDIEPGDNVGHWDHFSGN